ncbi:hypothetical protein BX592_10770 [Paraburkholderia rhizosphaerae]|uniref:Lipoprotein n=2 Tax=Paraburkholderia rhizosphaerae TaxID=480658 RepID=A0A4R8LWE6_9BURK|nr:hypothetical protein BX592_10770 [Paraburkholderia rhizosphaerae]
MPRSFTNAYPLAVLATCVLLAACGESRDTVAGRATASGVFDAASKDNAPASDNGTLTGLPPPPWAMSAPQTASDGLRPPVIHTVD